jgi:hypothetical protein
MKIAARNTAIRGIISGEDILPVLNHWYNLISDNCIQEYKSIRKEER